MTELYVPICSDCHKAQLIPSCISRLWNLHQYWFSSMTLAASIWKWQRFLDFITGDNQLQQRELPISASLLYYSTTLLVARLLRMTACSLHLLQPMQVYLLDFLASFQLVACSLENVMIRTNYGFYAYCVTLFMLGIWHSLCLQGERGSPADSFSEYLLGSMQFGEFWCRTGMQVLAGCVAYCYARLFWGLELSQGHGQRIHTACSSDLAVPFLIGLVIEAGGTFIDNIVSAGINLQKSTQFILLCKGTWGVMITLSGVHLTGMYLNPINASTQTLLCKGTSAVEHLIVYWLGPLLATAAANWLRLCTKQIILIPGEQSQSQLFQLQWRNENSQEELQFS